VEQKTKIQLNLGCIFGRFLVVFRLVSAQVSQSWHQPLC